MCVSCIDDMCIALYVSYYKVAFCISLVLKLPGLIDAIESVLVPAKSPNTVPM